MAYKGGSLAGGLGLIAGINKTEMCGGGGGGACGQAGG